MSQWNGPSNAKSGFLNDIYGLFSIDRIDKKVNTYRTIGATMAHLLTFQTLKNMASKDSFEENQKNVSSRDLQKPTWPISIYDEPYIDYSTRVQLYFWLLEGWKIIYITLNLLYLKLISI